MSVRKHSYTKRGESHPTANYYVFFKDHAGVQRKLSGYRDRKATLALERQLETLVGLRISSCPPDSQVSRWLEGLPEKTLSKLAAWHILEASRSLASMAINKHVDDFAAHLKGRGSTEKHVTQTIRRIKRVFDSARCRTWGDITGSRIQEALHELKTGKKDPKPVGAQTWNYHLSSLKQFCNWMVLERRATQSPIAHVNKRRVEKPHLRRALTEREVKKLLAKTALQPHRYGMTGVERARLYWLALDTGLRSNEIRSLRRSNFHLDAKRPHLAVEAGYSKRRREETIILRPSLVRALREQLVRKMPTAPAFPLPAGPRMARMLREDLAAADVEAEADDGRVDFHALRHTFVTMLARSGVLPQVAQRLARHSTITLTLDRYTHVHLEDELQALEKLPHFGLSPDEPRAVAATGTDGREGLASSLVKTGGSDATACDKDVDGELVLCGADSAQTLPGEPETLDSDLRGPEKDGSGGGT